MQFNVRYSENGRADTAQLAGFPNLGQVAHTGCRRVRCQPEYQNRPCGITDNAWRRTTNVVLPWTARLQRLKGRGLFSKAAAVRG